MAGLLVTVAGGLATVLLEGLEEEVEEEEETEGWVYAGNVALGGSEAATVLWEFETAAPEALCWACAALGNRGLVMVGWAAGTAGRLGITPAAGAGAMWGIPGLGAM